jgi:tetratricopeptide (TPR) repeat protein
MKIFSTMNRGTEGHMKERVAPRRSATKGGAALCLFALLLSVGIAGCEPTNEEIAAREQAKQQREAALQQQQAALRQQEEAKKREEQARYEAQVKAEIARHERVEAAVAAANQAVSQGRLDAALASLQGALKDIKRYENEVVGIGVQIAIIDGFPSVVGLSEGSPAYKAGVRTSDRIVQADGRSTQNMDIAGIVRLLRGPKGAPVTVTVLREGSDQTVDYRIVRDTVYIGDQQLREQIIKVVRAMSTRPALPEEAVRSMARGDTKVKMGGSGAYAAAAVEMEQAVLAAPWYADGYFNLAVVQERAEMFGDASKNFRLYVAAAPNAPNAGAIRSKIYSLEVMQEEKEKVQSLAGSWRSRGGNIYTVSVEGRKIRINGSSPERLANGTTQKWYYTFDFEVVGNSLEGSNTVARDPHSGCNFPNETVEASGTIGDGARSLKVNWKDTIYSWTWQGNVCTDISPMGTRDEVLELVERAAAGQRVETTTGAPATDAQRAREKAILMRKARPSSDAGQKF